MSQTTGITDHFPKLTTDMQNVILFVASIAAVVAILTYKRDLNTIEVAGTVIVVTLCYLVLYLFLFQFRHEVLRIVRKTFFILLAIFVFPICFS